MNQTIALPSGESYVEILGEGTPVIVVHGGLGLDHSYFRPYIDPLAERMQLVLLDLLGNGRSGPLPADFPVDHSVWTDQIDQLATALGFERFVLIGHSHGGAIAQRYALRHSERLLGLILVGTGPSFGHVQAIMDSLAERATPEEYRVFTEEIFVPQESDELWAARWRKVMGLYTAVRPSEETLDATHARVIHRAEGFNACLRHVEGFDVRAELPSLDVPTLVIGGEQDFAFPLEFGPEVLASLIPGATLVRFADSGHQPFAEEPEKFNAVVGDFVDSVSSATT